MGEDQSHDRRDRPRRSRDTSETNDRYTRSLEEQVEYLRAQLEQEREARTEERRRQDTVIAQLSRANEEQLRTIRELEAPSHEPVELPETVEHESEQENRIEGNKLAAEAAKTSVLLSSGALVGMAALVGVLPQNHHTYWLVAAIGLTCISVILSFSRMEELARSVAAQQPSPLSDQPSWGSLLLVMGLVAFALYVFYNVPFDNPSRLVRLEKEHVGWTSVILGILVGGIYYALRNRARLRSWWRWFGSSHE